MDYLKKYCECRAVKERLEAKEKRLISVLENQVDSLGNSSYSVGFNDCLNIMIKLMKEEY